MIAVIPQNWTGRVLDQGRLGITVNDRWKLEAYEQYKARLRAPEYPCFFGQGGEARGEMLYTFVAKSGLNEFVTNMQQFVSLIGAPPHERSSLVAFFEPDPSITDHGSFVARFWHVLQFLHEHDRNPATERTPDHPLWEFAFEGCEMFVVGASPTYQRRRSRNLGPCVVLVCDAQQRAVFEAYVVLVTRDRSCRGQSVVGAAAARQTRARAQDPAVLGALDQAPVDHRRHVIVDSLHIALQRASEAADRALADMLHALDQTASVSG